MKPDVVVDWLARLDVKLNDDDTFVLFSDVRALAVEEPAWNEELFEDVFAEWLRRVGGARNIRAYLASLNAGRRNR